jgi:hypothetical protein
MKMYEKEKRLSNPDGKIPLNKDGKPNFCRTITTKQDRWNNAGIIDFDGKFFEDGTRSIFRYLTPRESFLLMGIQKNNFKI